MKVEINGKVVETWNEDNVLICPYCGDTFEVDFETFSGREANTEEEIECENCGNTFTAIRECSFSYETFKKEKSK